MKNLFNTALFLTETNPLPQQIFAKAFDAYFFLHYPHNQYQQEGILNPFHFLNNISENKVTISNPMNDNRLEFQNKNWAFEAYFKQFDAICRPERFLFWAGETDKWAMVSDAKTGISVYGIDWKIANQIPFFYQDALLSPAQILAQLNLESEEAIFLKNYAPAAILTEGNTDNPMWIKYYCQCTVPTENDKLFYWQQFEPLHHALSTLLSKFKSVDMYADQAFWRRYKRKGQIYASGAKASVGGWQKYTYENCKKVATKFLTQNQHLVLQFEGKTEESEQLYLANKEGLIEFMTFWVYANIEKTKVKGQFSDFLFLTYQYNFNNKSVVFNQNFELSYRKSLLNDDAVAAFITKLTKICFVQKIHRLEQPSTFAKYDKNAPLAIEGIYGAQPDLSK